MYFNLCKKKLFTYFSNLIKRINFWEEFGGDIIFVVYCYKIQNPKLFYVNTFVSYYFKETITLKLD